MSTKLSTAPEQLSMDLSIARVAEIDGIEMGVLGNGTAFLTLRGLARMCDIDHSLVVRITEGWQSSPPRPRERKIRELVKSHGADDTIAFYAVPKDGIVQHIFPEAVCMAILEYYAFEASPPNANAAASFRRLARKGFADFIYELVGYSPESGNEQIVWQQFHDRVALSFHTVPPGYFSIFKELADIIVTLIRNGADIGASFVPDISVGIHWGKYWNADNLDAVYGARRKYEHNYPGYFPQAQSNPQHPFCYPDDALGEFRKWVRDVYLIKHMPNYLSDKVKQKQLPAATATAALDAFKPVTALLR